MNATDLAGLTAHELVQAYRSGDLSPVPVTEALLARVDAADEDLRAFVLVDEQSALTAAQQSEQRWRNEEPLSPLDGVPVSIKDLLPVRGWPTRSGSTTSRNTSADSDAPAPARLRAGGTVLFGKTATPEFGWKAVTDSPSAGITRNPWDRSRTAGGSSGGAAAAVAAGMGPLAIGTDGGGSIRIPAAFCGIVGFKPTWSRVAQWPKSALASLSHVGPMGRTVGDVALGYQVISQPDPSDWTRLPAETADSVDISLTGLRVAFSPTLGTGTVRADVADRVRGAVDLLDGLGAQVEPIDLDLTGYLEVFWALWAAGCATTAAHLDRAKRSALDPGLAAILPYGEQLSAVDLLRAGLERDRIAERLSLLLNEYDVLLTPTVPITAFEAGHDVPPGSAAARWPEWTPFSYPFNLSQQPAISVPCGVGNDGLPVGLQLVAAKFADRRLLSIADTYERQRGFDLRSDPAAPTVGAK